MTATTGIRALFISASLLCLCFLLFSSCSQEDSIKIGMLAPLTGRDANFGISARDGAILALEEANQNGGIDGKRVELIVRDSKLSKEQCKKVLDEFVSSNVSAIIGPLMSSMGIVSVPLINFHKLVTISPTVSTSELSGKDDYFFRIIPTSTEAAQRTAEHVVQNRGMRNVHVIYDLRNRSFTEVWYLAFKERFEELGGGELGSTSYFSEKQYDFLQLAEGIAGKQFEGLVILANAMDVALISQQLTKLDVRCPIFASEWSATEDLIEYGGVSIEGVEIFHSFNQNDTSPEYLDFSGKFVTRFGYQPSFSSAYSFNAMSVLLTAMKKGQQPELLKENIVKGSPYRGVQREIRFDGYGDVLREYTLLRIHNRKFISVPTDAPN